MLKSRRETNQLQRLHNKHRPRDSELGQNISDLYRKRKKLLHDAIKRNESHDKMNFFTDNCVFSRNKSKNFWNYLKGSRDISRPEHIIDPSNKEKRIEDNDDISKCLSSHFSRIGKDSTVNPDFHKLC